MAGIAYAAAMGNHDASKLRDADGGFAFAREREAAAAYWRDPVHLAGLDLVDGEGYPFAWSFRLGPLFVAVLDASGPVVDEVERGWLRTTLIATGADGCASLGHGPSAAARDRRGASPRGRGAVARRGTARSDAATTGPTPT